MIRRCSTYVFQGDRKYADEYGNKFDAVLGVCPNKAVGLTVPYLNRPVRDEDTPTMDDITAWVEFLMPYVVDKKHVLIHCEAGQNRSSIVAALMITLTTDSNWEETVEHMHNEFMKCLPPHNWYPYEHWNEAIIEWLGQQ